MLLHIIPVLLTVTLSSATEQKCVCIVKPGVYFESDESAKPSFALPVGSCFELRHRNAGSLLKLRVNSQTGYVKKSAKVKIDICTTNDSTNKIVVKRWGSNPCLSTNCQQCFCNWTPGVCDPCSVCRLMSRAMNCNPPLPGSYGHHNGQHQHSHTTSSPPLGGQYQGYYQGYTAQPPPINNNVCYTPTCLKCKCDNTSYILTSLFCLQCLSCQIPPSQCLGYQVQGLVLGGLGGFINQLINGPPTNIDDLSHSHLKTAHLTIQNTPTATKQKPSTAGNFNTNMKNTATTTQKSSPTGTTGITTGTTSVSLQSLCLSNHCMTCECTSKIPYHQCKIDCGPCRNYPMHCGYFRQHGYPKTTPTVSSFSTQQWTGTGTTNKATGTTSLSLQSLCLSYHCMICECTYKLPYHQCKIDCGACRNFPMHCGYFRQHGYAKTTTAMTLPSTTTQGTTTGHSKSTQSSPTTTSTTTPTTTPTTTTTTTTTTTRPTTTTTQPTSGPKSSTGNIMLTFTYPPFPFRTNGPVSQQG